MLFFFFSSRRRHTRCLSDWSSDVCSSDLIREPDGSRGATEPIGKHTSERDPSNDVAGAVQIRVETLGPAELIVREPMPERSEERRVGKECRARSWTDDGTE